MERSALEELRELDMLRMAAIRQALRDDPTGAMAHVGLQSPTIAATLRSMSYTQMKRLVEELGSAGIFRIVESPALEAAAQAIVQGRDTDLLVESAAHALSK